MEKEDVLKVEIIKINDEWSVGYINYQNEEVLKRGVFEDKEIGVSSVLVPCYYSNADMLFIFGTEKDKDKESFVIPNKDLMKLKNKIIILNAKYGIKKRWRAEKNGKYYFVEINQNAKIILTAESSRFLDDERYKFGNYFQTRELAEKYLVNLKEFNMKWHEENGADGNEL